MSEENNNIAKNIFFRVVKPPKNPGQLLALDIDHCAMLLLEISKALDAKDQKLSELQAELKEAQDFLKKGGEDNASMRKKLT